MNTRKIMDAVQDALDNIYFSPAAGTGSWTRAIFTALCQAGQRRGYKVAARPSAVNQAVIVPSREWLYDLTWRKYDGDGRLAGMPLAAECEFSSYSQAVAEDFAKLLPLSPATLRLMVCREWPFNDISQGMPAYLAEHIQHYVDRSSEDTYLLAMWHWDDERKAFRFKYFLLGPDGAKMKEAGAA